MHTSAHVCTHPFQMPPVPRQASMQYRAKKADERSTPMPILRHVSQQPGGCSSARRWTSSAGMTYTGKYLGIGGVDRALLTMR